MGPNSIRKSIEEFRIGLNFAYLQIKHQMKLYHPI
jgi:hypothetical protein